MVNKDLYIVSESRFLPTPPAFDAPLGGSRANIATQFGTGKLEWFGWWWKILKICLFVMIQSRNVTDTHTHTHTDGQTDTVWRQRPRLHNITRQKLPRKLLIPHYFRLAFTLWPAYLSRHLQPHNCVRNLRSSSEAEVTNNRRLRSTYCTIAANYIQTRSIARPPCNNRCPLLRI